jgi:hypothetical protein
LKCPATYGESTKKKQTKFILGAVYIHPNVPQEAVEYFMFQMLGAYSEAIRLIFPNMNMNLDSDSTVRRLQHGHYAKQIICELYEIQIQFGLH